MTTAGPTPQSPSASPRAALLNSEAAKKTRTAGWSEFAAAQAQPLPEFKRYHPRPGHPDWPRLQAEACALAAEIAPTLELPQRGLPRLRRRLQAWRTAAGNYVANRRLAKAGREDLRPLYFIWTTLRTCNFTCTYCDDHQGRKYPELPNDGVLDTAGGKRLLEVMRTRTPSVYFAGGEPTVRQDLPELSRHAVELGYDPIIINTNGSLIARNLKQPNWRTWLADTDIIIVSLDALDLGLLADMWVYRKPQDVLRNLLMLNELKEQFDFKLMINCVIQPGRIDEARAVLEFAEDMGIWFTPVPMNEGPTVHAGVHLDPAYPALVETILERKKAGARITGSLRMNRRLLKSEPLECRNTLKPHIDYDGKLAWPCKASVNVKPEYIDVLQFDDVDSLYDHASRRIDPTRFHGPACNQCGANCNWAQNYSTDAYAHGLRHPASLLGEVRDFLRPS